MYVKPKRKYLKIIPLRWCTWATQARPEHPQIIICISLLISRNHLTYRPKGDSTVTPSLGQATTLKRLGMVIANKQDNKYNQ